MYTCSATVSENEITIAENIHVTSDIIYLYSDKNEKIFKLDIEDTYIENSNTIFVVPDKIIPQNNVSVDLVTEDKPFLSEYL